MKRFFAFLLMLSFCAPGLFAQSADDIMVQQAVNQLVSKKTFSFVANRILTGGSSAMLRSMNTFKVNKDTLTIALPYIGKGGTGSGSESGNPLQFTSSDFTYKVEVTKKGDKIITMDVKSPNGTDRFNFVLTIGKGVMAKLSITSATYSPMDYSGYIQDLSAQPEE